MDSEGIIADPAGGGRDFKGLLNDAILALLREQIKRAGPDFFFVQIGANDGVSFSWVHQFVRDHRLRGLVVEPLHDLFRELRESYKDHPQVTPVNVALHRTQREVDLYRVDPQRTAGLPDWAKAIASVNPEHHLKSRTPSKVIIRETAKAITFAELLEAHRVERVDFLQIDVEGYDQEIVRMIDFDRIKPAIIRFEHNRRSDVMSREDLVDCFRILIDAGYYVLMDPVDAVAYLKN